MSNTEKKSRAWAPAAEDAELFKTLYEKRTAYEDIGTRFNITKNCVFAHITRERKEGRLLPLGPVITGATGAEVVRTVGHRGWQPDDIEAFKVLYYKPATYDSIAATFETTAPKVFRFVKYARAAGLLPDKNGLTVKEDEAFNQQVLKTLKSSTAAMSIVDLSNLFDKSPNRIAAAINELRQQNFLVELNEHGYAKFDTPSAGSKHYRKLEYLDTTRRIRVGLVSDAHLCSRYERLDCLNTMYDIFEKEGITTVFDTGNQLDGEARFNKSDLNVHGLGNQVNYWVKNWPARKGITTEFICGDDHEGWWVQNSGIDIGRYMESVAKEAGREDLVYRGYMESDIIYTTPEGGKTIIRLQHPGGGSSYAVSYTPQKIVESLSGGEKPNILLLGHYHKSGYFYVRNVHTVLSGCFMDQSPFMRKKRLAAHVGGYILDIVQAPDGSVLRFNPTFIPFYGGEDQENWHYHMYNND